MCFLPDWLKQVDQYWYAIFSAFIGTVMGILWGEFRFRQNQKKQKPIVIGRLIESLTSISSLVTQAIRRMEGMKRGEDIGFPNYTLDSISLVGHLEKAAIFLPRQVISDTDGTRYQIEHANNKMQMLYFIQASDDSRKVAEHREFASLLEHLKMVDGWISERKKEIGKGV